MELFLKLGAIYKAIQEYINEFRSLSMRMKISFLCLLTLFVLATISLAFVGCTSPSAAYVEADYVNAQVALVDLIDYIKKDASLQPLDKEVRIKSVEKWKLMIDVAYQNLKNTK